jgi:predicted DNA-binding transcriptional regulator AlpA
MSTSPTTDPTLPLDARDVARLAQPEEPRSGNSMPLKEAALERLALGAADVAKMLDISERHLWGLHSSGRLGPKPISLGRSKRWCVAELRAWLAAGAPCRDRWLAHWADSKSNIRI